MYTYHRGVVVLVSCVLVLLGLALLAVGFAGLAGRLPRNRWAGVRTPAAMSCDEAFALANRVAGPAILTSGVLGVLTGAGVLGLDGSEAVLVGVVGGLGALGLVLAGGVLGGRAAAARVSGTAPVGPHARCADCTGCELMSSVRA